MLSMVYEFPNLIIIPETDCAVYRSVDYPAVLQLLEQVEFARIIEELGSLMTIELIMESESLLFNVTKDSDISYSDDSITIFMPEDEDEVYYGHKLLERVQAAYAEKGVELTIGKRMHLFMDFYESLKGQNPRMDANYREIFPGSTFNVGMKLGMVKCVDRLNDIWQFV